MIHSNISLTVVYGIDKSILLNYAKNDEATLVEVGHYMDSVTYVQIFVTQNLKTQFGESRTGEMNSELVHITVLFDHRGY